MTSFKNDAMRAKLESEYLNWLEEVYGKDMYGKKKRNNKALRSITPTDLVHTNPMIRAKAKRILKAQRG